MNNSIKSQLEFLWCEGIDIDEPILKPTESTQESTKDIKVTLDRSKYDEGLKRE